MGQPQGHDPREIIHRLGTFFLLVGTGLLVFFLLSDAAGTPTFSYFCWSMILGALGFIFRGRYKRSIQSSGRFSIIQRLMPKSKVDKGKK
jgi:peptidoglycan/LPS O-acetylase OafA/YrhL